MHAADKFFQDEITKVGIMEKRELNEDFFNQLYPNQEVKTEDDFRNKIKEEIENYWNAQANNQIHDQVFHQLVDHTKIDFPEEFSEKMDKDTRRKQSPKTDEEVEKEFPIFLNQLKWTLISDKIVQDNAIEVAPDEMKSLCQTTILQLYGR